METQTRLSRQVNYGEKSDMKKLENVMNLLCKVNVKTFLF